MLATINHLFGARYATYEAGELREYVFSVLPLFLSQHFLKLTSTVTRVISINIPVWSTILAGSLLLGGRSYEILKLAIIVLSYTYDFIVHQLVDF